MDEYLKYLEKIDELSPEVFQGREWHSDIIQEIVSDIFLDERVESIEEFRTHNDRKDLNLNSLPKERSRIVNYCKPEVGAIWVSCIKPSNT